MKFKYKAPPNFCGTSIEYAGHTYHVKNGILESDTDILSILNSQGFTRVEQPAQSEKKQAEPK